MAVIDIIGISEQEINWDLVHKKIFAENFSILEVFPIPKKIGFEKDAIGVTIPSKKGKNVTGAASEIKKIIDLLKDDFQFTDLYDGALVTTSNIGEITFRCLGTR